MPGTAEVSPELPAGLGEIGLGDRLLTAPAELAVYASDALTAFSARPLAVALVESAAEVVATVRACNRAGIPFVARGSGTSLSGGSLPVEGGVVIALNRLDRVLSIDPDRCLAVVEPGVINQAVTDAALPHGLRYAPDPSSQSVCTIGGNVAFNSGGAHCLKHGMTSNHVLGLRVVLPDGTVTELGGETLEPVGPDWTGMFCGSEGLFGIATEITLRLIPTAESTHTVLAAYPSLESAGDAVAEVLATGMLPVAMEIMDKLAMEAAEAAVQAGYPECAALLIVELEGEAEEVDAGARRLSEVLRGSGATELREVREPDRRATVWRGRKSAFSAIGWLAPDYIVQDGVVPRTKLAAALGEIGRMSVEADIPVANVFHAGDGNLHPLILFDAREQGMLERAEALAGRILELCVRLGGSITGEHGIGVEKLSYMETMFSGADLGLMERLRRAVDPAALANRGKALPWR